MRLRSRSTAGGCVAANIASRAGTATLTSVAFPVRPRIVGFCASALCSSAARARSAVKKLASASADRNQAAQLFPVSQFPICQRVLRIVTAECPALTPRRSRNKRRPALPPAPAEELKRRKGVREQGRRGIGVSFTTEKLGEENAFMGQD